jgi:hypothetical protein
VTHKKQIINFKSLSLHPYLLQISTHSSSAVDTGAVEETPTFLKVIAKAVVGGRAAREVATVRADLLVFSRHHELVQ